MAMKYRWLAERLEEMIQKNIQNGVNKLPTEQELCARYRVSRQTVRNALSLLKERGLIERRQGSGSFITGRSLSPLGNQAAILISDDQEYLYPGVLSDIRKRLTESGFSARVLVTENQVETERELLLELLKNPPGGIIAEGCKTALPNPNLALYRELEKKGCPAVFLYSYYPALENSLYVKDDNAAGSALLVEHLASLGHRSIAGIFKGDDMQGVERYQGFAETMFRLGLPFSDRRIGWYGSRELDRLIERKDTGFLRDMARDVLSSCTAVVCYNDLLAYHLTGELLSMGFRLPADMAVTAFDNTYLSNVGSLSVTTLSHRPHEMGTKAADLLVRKKSGLPVFSWEARWELNLKESTKT